MILGRLEGEERRIAGISGPFNRFSCAPRSTSLRVHGRPQYLRTDRVMLRMLSCLETKSNPKATWSACLNVE